MAKGTWSILTKYVHREQLLLLDGCIDQHFQIIIVLSVYILSESMTGNSILKKNACLACNMYSRDLVLKI